MNADTQPKLLILNM